MIIEFKSIFIIIIFSVILSSIIAGASFVLSSKQPDKEKVSIYECGFDPLGTPGQPFSIRFFLVGILFLVFDVEIAFIFPWSIFPSISYWAVITFLFILTLGLIYEWLEGGLEWE